MKRLSFFLLALSIALSALAQQSLDILTISGRYGLPQSYDDTYTQKATEAGLFLGLTAPIVLSEKTIIYNSLNYFYFNVQGDSNIPENIANPINIHGIILRTGLYQKFGNGQGLQLLFAPRMMSDMTNSDGKSFQFGGMALYEKVFSDQLTLSFGAMYNQELFGPYLVPLVNVNWVISSKWSIAGMLPIYAKVNYHVSDNLTVGFSHFGLITSYALGDPAYSGDYIERQSIDLSLFARQRLFGNFFLEGRVGRSFGRGYKQFAGDQKVKFAIPLVAFGDDRVEKNSTFKDGIIFDLRFVFNIPIPE